MQSKSDQTKRANEFENNVASLLDAALARGYNLYTDKESTIQEGSSMKKMGDDLIKTRPSEDQNFGVKSHPDFIVTKTGEEGGLKSVVIDAKSHLKEISATDCDKMISDCKLHKCHGVMIISESATMSAT